MICPICKVMGLKSTLVENCCFKTSLFCCPFYDENGNDHHHDRNDITTPYECSNGHKFRTVTREKCPQENCDWNKNLKKLIFFDEDGLSEKEIEDIKNSL